MKKVLIILLFLPVICFGQRRRLTPTGALLRQSPFTTITGSNEQNLYADTIQAKSLTRFMKANVRVSCNLTSGLGLTTLTIRFVNGANSITLINALSIGVSMSNKPFKVECSLTNQGNGNGYLYCVVSQDGSVINTASTYYATRAIIPVDFNAAQPIYLKATLGGVGLGAATIGIDEIERQ